MSLLYDWRNAGVFAVVPILVKRYRRSRLYDTAEGRYVTVDDLRQWRREGIAFWVQDDRRGPDERFTGLKRP
jgi:polyhydroxyalkanoate synthesis regulator protein